jgi:hypothetical protein
MTYQPLDAELWPLESINECNIDPPRCRFGFKLSWPERNQIVEAYERVKRERDEARGEADNLRAALG